MASRMLVGLSSLAGRSPACSHATSARAAVSLTQMYRHAAFTSAVNNGDAAPVTGSEEDRERAAAAGDGPVSPAAGKTTDVGGEGEGRRGGGEGGRAKEVGEDVKESVKETR